MSKRSQLLHYLAANREDLMSSSNGKVCRHSAQQRDVVAGGAYRDRTDDLKLAKLALSQLS